MYDSLDPIEKEKKKMPGPGNYNPNEYYISNKERPLSAKIGSSNRQPLSMSGN